MHVGIIGTGYVGLVTGACFAEFGAFVTCMDRNADKIEKLKSGIVPFHEPGLDRLVEKNLRDLRLSFTTSIADAVNGSNVMFIAVGTPPRGDGSTDVKEVEAVTREISMAVDEYKVIATKSTVPVGTAANIRSILSGRLREGIDFDVVSNPEFLREGSAIEDFMHPDRVIIGSRSQKAIAILKDLYRPLYLIETPFVITTIETAELIKYASNAFLAAKISFINEMANLCERVGGNVQDVARGMGLDRRIGPKFLHPGPGYGGSCLPKDTRALLKMAEEKDVRLGVVSSAVEANERQRRLAIERIRNTLGGFSGKTVAVLGLSFKPNTDDVREAPALDIIRAVLDGGGAVRAFDPAAMEAVKSVFPGIQYGRDAYETAEAADALVIVTEWNLFRNLDLERIRKLLRQPFFFDLRNIYEPEKMLELGFTYVSSGRLHPPSMPDRLKP